MKKIYIIPLFIAPLLFTSCKDDDPVSPTLESIAVKNPVVEYIVGDAFIKPTVIASYSDDSIVDVTNETTFSGYNMNVADTYTVTATYLDKTDSYAIVVSNQPVILKSITVSNVKESYFVNDDFVKPTVTAHYSDDSSEDVTTEATFTGYDMSTAGDYTVTVSYKTKSTTFNISVNRATLEYITIDNEVVKYFVGDTFIKPTVIAHYTDASTKDVTSSSTCTGYDMDVAGDYTVTVSYLSKNVTYTIKVIDPALSGITLSDKVTKFVVGDEFVKATVTASFENGSTKDVTAEATFTGYNMSVAGDYTVTVTYLTKGASYSITVSEPIVTNLSLDNIIATYYQGDEFVKPTVTATYENGTTKDVTDIASFTGFDIDAVGNYTVVVSFSGANTEYNIEVLPLAQKPKILDIELRELVTSFQIKAEFVKAKVFALYDNDTEANVTNSATFAGYNMNIADTYTVTVTYLSFVKEYQITVSAKPISYITVIEDISLATSLGKVTNLDGESRVYSEISFSFNKNSGSNNPISSKDNGGYIALYTSNSMTISKKGLSKVSFDFVGGKNGNISCDGGETSQTSSTFSWVGSVDSLTLTANAQVRLNAIHIEYQKIDKPDPSLEGVSTIAEVKQAASEIDYVLNNSGWYLSTIEVTIQVEAIDAIDSTSTGKEYDGEARGKVLVCDETGYIICSSGVSTNNPISFYQRVKDYLKAGTTQYVVKGHIAFFNDVVEVKVSEYQYDSSLEIDKKYDSYVSKTFSKSDEFVNDVIDNVKTNDAGYGVGEVVKMTGLTLINEYNHQAGSYLFVDQEGNLIPVFSVLNKDRTQLVNGKCYDIIGLESRYKNRPSFRILKLSNSSLDSKDFDFRNNVTEVTDLKQFYNLGYSDNESYVKSELTVYKADVYVSSYAEDKYTFNTSYFYDGVNKEYTTGNSQVNAASHYSLGIFNEDLDYKQTLLDFILNGIKDEEVAKTRKVTLYFTLAYLDTVDSKNMWRVNIFEDLVYGLDYYYSDTASMTFDVNESTCDRVDGQYQTWSNSDNSLVVCNYSNDEATITRVTNYLKIVDGTSVSITFDHDIVAFTLYTGTYSSIAGFGSFSDNIKAYVQRSSYTLVILKEKTKSIIIDSLLVSGNATNPYLKVDSITVNY